MPKHHAPIHRSAKDGHRMVLGTFTLVLVGLGAGCDARRDSLGQATTRGRPGGEAAYHQPPEATFSQRQANGAILLAGATAPGAKVRLASPQGQLTPATESGPGAWRVKLPGSEEVRLFGLAAVEPGRTIQSDGYLAVTPTGLSAQLRPGSGARVIGATGPMRILSVDFDRKGGVVVSGVGPVGATVSVFADGARRGRAPVDSEGRFNFPLDEPLNSGDHTLEVADGPNRSSVEVTISPPAPLTTGPYRATWVASGWRIDWLTPGGGVQATILPRSEDVTS